MDPAPHPGTNPLPSSVAHVSYAESVESSPRSRTTETWDDRESVAAGGGKLRLMCSFGGHIIPRPHDKSLSYVGGDTRMVVVDRNISLGELHARLSRILLHNRPFTLKYQLPSEDLDSLITVTSDEDLENMIDEFDRICESSSVAKSSRLRVFLFVNNHESASSLEVIFGGSVKSEDWFYNALNGSKASADDAKSVNSLLGLDNASFKPGNSIESEADFKNLKSNNQETTQFPDSAMIHTSPSSFGSTSSLLANLPPIRVRVEGGDVNGRNKVRDERVGVEEQFAQMSVSAGGKQDDGFAAMSSPPPIPITLIPAAVNPGGELPERIISDNDERSELAVPVGYVRTQTQSQLPTQLQQQQTQPQQKPNSPDSASSDGNTFHQELPPGISRITSNIPWTQVQQNVSESGYIMHSRLEQQQLQHQLQQLQQQQQNQQHHQQQQQNQQQQQQNQQHQQQQQNQQHQPQQQNQQHQQQQQNQQHQPQQQNQQHQPQQQNQQHRQQQQNQRHRQQQQNQQNHQQQNQQNHQQQQQNQQNQQQQQNLQQHQQHQQQQEHLQQQQQQQQEHLQQQQQQQHQQQQQQQHQQQMQQHQQQLQPQQFIHPGTHYLQHPQNAMPISQYYQMYPQPTQHHQTQLDQHQYPFYFMPPMGRQPQQAYSISMQQTTYSEPSNAVPSSRSGTPPAPTNTSAYSNQPRNVTPDNSEMVSGDYRAAIPSVQSIVQMAPGQQQHQQAFMTYPQVYHAPQSMAQPQSPALATNSSYAYEYSDPAHSQIYCSQPLAHPAQYQTVVSSSPMVMVSDASSVQNPNNNNLKHQNSNQAQ